MLLADLVASGIKSKGDLESIGFQYSFFSFYCNNENITFYYN
jgi:hypothetical protein